MKKGYFGLFFALVFLSATVTISAQTPSATAFAGTWTLDQNKTKMQDLPREFNNYRLVIAQAENKIGIKNNIDGQIIPDTTSKSSSNVARTSDGIWGDGRAQGAMVKPEYGGSMALSKSMTPPEVAYEVDGQEKTVEVRQPDGTVVGTAKTKAKLGKDGKSLQVTTVRRFKTMKAGQTEFIVYTREKWDLLEDGKTLKYAKTVELPNATDDILLFFTKDATQQ